MIRYCGRCGWYTECAHQERRKVSRSTKAAWIAFAVFVAMALIFVLGSR